MRKFWFVLLVFILGCGYSQAQTDTLKVMSYNILNFPNMEPNRIDTLKGILSHIKPDIFMICELNSGAGADDILFNALNVDGETSYAMATYENGPGSDNELYYNSDKLTLKEQNQIPTVLRDISEYVLYYNSVDIATTGDTVFFYVYVAHLKASSGWESQRLEEVEAMKDYMATRTNAENIILGGDFNFYSSITEPAWEEILSGEGVTLKDPINAPGNWNSNAGYAPIHTQSTRTSVLPDGGATGGMDSRFDFIFLGPDAMNGSNDVTYVFDSYRAVGQDGLHYNDALLDAPINTSEPWDIISKLYYMSDHLPIYLELAVISEAANIAENENNKMFYDQTEKSIKFLDPSSITFDSATFEVYDVQGRMIKSQIISSSSDPIQVEDLDTGVYFVKCFQLNLELKFLIE